MHIAVVGMGLAGMAAGWHLLRRGCKVTFFDERGVGQGASGIAAGLLHPYVGEKANRSWRATEGLAHTEELIAVSEKALGRSVCVQRGVMRRALDAEQRTALRTAKEKWGDVEEVAPDQFLLRSGVTIDVPLYLEGLLRASQQLGAHVVHKKISLDHAMPKMDHTIFACGSHWLSSPFARKFPLKAVKGQVLLLKCSEPVEKSQIAKGYLAATWDPHVAHLGATYEKQFADEQPSAEVARRELLPRAPLLLPSSTSWEMVGCRAGVRLMRQGSHIPYVERLEEKCWWIGAFGSRGLLYHAYFAHRLAEALFPVR